MKQKIKNRLCAIFAFIMAFAMFGTVYAEDTSQSTNVYYEDAESDFINEYSVSIPATLDLRNDMQLQVTLDDTSILTETYNVYVELDGVSFSGSDPSFFYLFDERNPEYYRTYKIFRFSDNQPLQGGSNPVLNIVTFDSSRIGDSALLSFSEYPSYSNYSPSPTRYSSSLTFNIHGEYSY